MHHVLILLDQGPYCKINPLIVNMHIVLRFILEHAAVDWAAAQSHHLLHRHLQTYSEMNQLSEHLLQRLAGWYCPRIFVYCVKHVLLGDLVITEGVHP